MLGRTAATRTTWLTDCYNLVLLLVCLMPFLVPFAAPGKNIDLQAAALIVAGVLATTVLYAERAKTTKYSRLWQVLVGIFLVTLLLSTIVSPHLGYDLYGGPYIRLGSLELASCLSCGLLLRQLPLSQLLRRLYGICCGLAISAIPLNLLRLQTIYRLGGAFAQADILALTMGIGLIVGAVLWQTSSRNRLWLSGGQLIQLVVLALTQTRAVLALTIVLALCLIVQQTNHRRRALYAIAGIAIILVGASPLLPSRERNGTLLYQSTQYRLDLQTAAAKALWHKPITGYGPGNLADALVCSSLRAPALQQTCHNHFFFNSSHNIFLDRFLALGLVGGLSFALLVGYSLFRGLKYRREPVILYCAALISFYYFTNVTHLVIELFLWICLVRLAALPDNKSSSRVGSSNGSS